MSQSFSFQTRFVALVAMAAVVFLQLVVTKGADDGLARSPPMGWRSWNSYAGEVNDKVMKDTTDAMVAKRDPKSGRILSTLETVAHSFASYFGAGNGGGISLRDLGYDNVGLDDNWQACGKGVNGSFHDEQGLPLLNKDRFPDMKGMVDYIHKKGMKVGWYHNNCICKEKKIVAPWGENSVLHYEGDVAATIAFGFDSVKLDGCGDYRDLDLFYKLYSKHNVMIENCHWGQDTPTLDYCPYHLFRSSLDISPDFDDIINKNLASMRKFQDPKYPISRPGCWAYPDMLEVGKLKTLEEDRAHFGAWIIASSPLILGHKVVDETLNGKIWSVIANQAAIEVNQQWAGHPGRIIKEAKGVQLWLKPLAKGAFALFALGGNAAGTVEAIVADLVEDCGAKPGQRYVVRDIWDSLNEVTSTYIVSGENQFNANVRGHDSIFLRFDAASNDIELMADM